MSNINRTLRQAHRLVGRLEWAEVTSGYEPDTYRVIREQRFALLAAISHPDRNIDRITAAIKEAKRVAKMWGVEL